MLLALTVSVARAQPWGHGPFVAVHGGLSSYLGDNNTTPLNSDAFRVPGKAPLGAGLEVGYQFSFRWQVAVGLFQADYPLITRFDPYRDFTHDPTTRRTYRLLVRYRAGTGRLAPYVHAGAHLTFGDVTIFEAMRLWKGQPLNVQHHYIFGPLFGVGLTYSLTHHLALFADLTAHFTLMDDSVDGRLPLGPPQPTSFGAKNRFGTFDLLSGLGLGLRLRPWCGTCDGPPPRRGPRRWHPLFRLSRPVHYDGLAAAFLLAPAAFDRLFFGFEGGLLPRSIFVRYLYPDGQESTDETLFTGAFLGLSARYYPLGRRPAGPAPSAGVTVAVPAHVRLSVGLDVALTRAWAAGLEARYVLCPDRRRAIDGRIGYRMRRACTARGGVGLSLSYFLH